MAEWTTNEEITKDKLNDRRGFKNYLRAYLSANSLKIENAQTRRVRFDVEDYDNNNEFDNSEITGIADATESLKLHDADGGFSASDVGKKLYNITNGTHAGITGFVDSGELDIDNNIMASGESYVIYVSLFTVKDAGLYQIYSQITFSGLVDQTTGLIKIHKNNSVNGEARGIIQGSGTGSMSVSVFDELVLAVNDYIDIRAYQSSGATKTINNAIFATYLIIRRVA